MFLYKGKSKLGVEVQAVGNKLSQKFDFLLFVTRFTKEKFNKTNSWGGGRGTDRTKFGMQSSIPTWFCSLGTNVHGKGMIPVSPSYGLNSKAD